MATGKTTTIKTTAELDGEPTPVDVVLDLTFPELGGEGHYALNDAWKSSSGFDAAKLARVRAWLDDVNDAGERIEHELSLAQGLRTRFTAFMEAQGFRPALHLEDGSRIFERDNSHRGPTEALVVRVRHGLEFEFKDVPPQLVEQTLSGKGPSHDELAFDGFEGESRPLTQFMSREGLSTSAQMTEELRAWRRVFESPEALPPPVGIRARLERGALSPDQQVRFAEEFAKLLRERGFVRTGRHDDLPVHTRMGRVGRGREEQIIWRIGDDGAPRYKPFEGRITETPFGYDSLDSAERDFPGFLAQEKLPPERLPSGFNPSLALPIITAAAARDPEQAAPLAPRESIFAGQREALEEFLRDESEELGPRVSEIVASGDSHAAPTPAEEFETALLDAGYRLHSFSERGPIVPIHAKQTGNPERPLEFLAWRLGDDGAPYFKRFQGEADLDQAGGYPKLRELEADFATLLLEERLTAERLPTFRPREVADDMTAPPPLPRLAPLGLDENFLISNPRVFSSLLEAQGFRQIFAFDDKTLVFERGEQLNVSQRELIAFRVVDGCLVWHADQDLDMVRDRPHDSAFQKDLRETTVAFSDDPKSLLAFLQREGLDSLLEARQELSAWQTYSEHGGLPPLTGLRVRYADGRLSPNLEVEQARAFATILHETGFAHTGSAGAHGQWPVYSRTKGEEVERLILAIAEDGQSRFKRIALSPGVAATDLAATSYKAIPGPEGDLERFLRAEGLPLERLPAGYPIALPLDKPSLARTPPAIAAEAPVPTLAGPAVPGVPGPSLSGAVPATRDISVQELRNLWGENGPDRSGAPALPWSSQVTYHAFLTTQGFEHQRSVGDRALATVTRYYQRPGERGVSRPSHVALHFDEAGGATWKPFGPTVPGEHSLGLSFADLPGSGLPFEQLLVQDGRQPAEIPKELAAWSAWERRPEVQALTLDLAFATPADVLARIGGPSPIEPAVGGALEGPAAATNFWQSQANFTTFLMAQGFQSEGWLPDGTRLYFRPNHEEPLLANGLPAGELIAARLDEQGDIRWRTASRGEVRSANAYAELPQAEQDLVALLRREGLSSPTQVQRQLQAWASWASEPGRLPPASIRTALEQAADGDAAVPGSREDDLGPADGRQTEALQESTAPQVFGLEAMAADAEELPDGSRTPTRQAPSEETPAAYANVTQAVAARVNDPKAERDRGQAMPPTVANDDKAASSSTPMLRDEPAEGEAVALGGPLPFGWAAAAERLADYRLEAAGETARLGASVRHAGLITFGPERARTKHGEVHRLVLWNMDPAGGPGGPVSVMFDAPFSKNLSALRPGDFIAVDGFAPKDRGPTDRPSPWQNWAGAVVVPGHVEPVAPLLTQGPPRDEFLREAFGTPHLYRSPGSVNSPANFAAAMREPAIRIGTTLDGVKLAEQVHGYARQRQLGLGTEEAIRFAFEQREPTLPAALGGDLHAWVKTNEWSKHFRFETPAAALERRLSELPEMALDVLDKAGIEAATLDAPQFKGLLRTGAGGVVALTSDWQGPQGLMETALTLPGRARIIAGEGNGVWLSAAAETPCTRIIITPTPLIALACHQRHPDPHTRYIAVGGDALTLEQRKAVRQLLDDIEQASPGKQRPELVVAGHHKAAGQQLLHHVAITCSKHRVKGILPPLAQGGDWLEVARRVREPEHRLNLPAYAQERLGYEPVYRSPDGKQIVMGLRNRNIPTQPMVELHTATGQRIRHRIAPPVGPKVPQFLEQLAFTSQPDGSWQYQNDRAHADDRGSAADFARTRLQLSLEEFRADLRRFELTREFKNAPELATQAREVNLRGIYPDTIADACFVGSLRQDSIGRLVYSHQDAKGMCGFSRSALEGGRPDHVGGRGVWLSNPSPNREAITKLVVVDHPLTALAYHQQNPARGVRYIAAEGPELSNDQKSALRAAVAAAKRDQPNSSVELVVAASGDRAGRDFTGEIAKALSVKEGVPFPVKSHTPAYGRDWNESVQKRERDFIRSLGGPRKRDSLSL